MTTNELTPKEKQEATEREATRPGRTYVPDVDVAEDDHALYFWVDVPGVATDTVAVDLHDDVLTIRGDVSGTDYEGLTPVYTEYNVGPYARRFTVSDGAAFDTDRITARLTDGVLAITLPKSERVRPRRIPVTA